MMAKYFDKDEIKESSSEKKIRIFLAVMYFLLVLTEVWMPLMYGPVNDEGQYSILTAVNLLIQPNGYGSAGQVMSAIYGAILVILPIVSFFFFLLDALLIFFFLALLFFLFFLLLFLKLFVFFIVISL